MAPEEGVLALLKLLLHRPEVPVEERLSDSLRVLAKYRTEQLEEALAREMGERVRAGPFVGMRFPLVWREGCYLPKLLGVYERELEPLVRSFPARGYRSVVNAGCAEGYYAVGLARMLPDARVVAFESDPRARAHCADLAALNDVGVRLRLEGEVAPSSFEGHAEPALVLCDIEGAEVQILDPSLAPDLKTMDVLVEVHDAFRPGAGEALTRRFGSSHRVSRIESGSGEAVRAEGMEGRDQLDQLLALWEGRVAGVYWLWMEARGA